MTSHMVRRHTHKKSIWTKHKTEDRIKKSRKIVLFSKIFWILRIQLLGRICHCTKGWLFKGLKTFSWVYFAMSVINNSASTPRPHKHPLPRGVQCAEMLGTMHVTHDACDSWCMHSSHITEESLLLVNEILPGFKIWSQTVGKGAMCKC